MAERSRARSIRARLDDRILGGQSPISASIVSRCSDDHLDQFARQLGGLGIAFALGQVALQDGVCGPLAELRFEDRRERELAGRPSTSDPVSPRRHRPAIATEPEIEAEQPLDRWPRPPSGPGSCSPTERLARPGHDPDTHQDRSSRSRMLTERPPRTRRQSGPPRATRTTPGDLEGRQAHQLGDDRRADGQYGTAHETASAAMSAVEPGPGATLVGLAANDSAMSSGTR